MRLSSRRRAALVCTLLAASMASTDARAQEPVPMLTDINVGEARRFIAEVEATAPTGWPPRSRSPA